MSDSTGTTVKCGNCSKTENLKRCSRCQTERYCSQDCQKAHWKTHKKNCRSSPTAQTQSQSQPQPQSTVPKGLTAAIDKPFHKLEARTWLHDRPEKDAYKLLIDTFRLKLDDDYKFEGDVFEGTVYDGAPNSIPGFKKFLRQAKSKPGLLPPWWSDDKAAECIAFGMSGSWASLSAAPEKSDIVEHYGNPEMPMQMRMLSEQITGRGPRGQDGTAMRKLMMEGESGKGVTSTMDWSHMFTHA